MIQEKRKQRFVFLEKLYESTDGSTSGIVMMYELGNMLGFDRNTTSNIVEYLEGESLIRPMTLGGGISITHNGVLEIEQALENPDKATEHFPPINIITIQNMNNSAIQQGSINSTQNVNFNIDKIADLNGFINHLEKIKDQLSLNDTDTDELNSEIDTLKSQSKSPKPKQLIITESLKTVRTIFESVTASAISAPVLSMIQNFIS